MGWGTSGKGPAMDNVAEERLRRREYETFLRLVEADEEMRAVLHRRVRFPGEGAGYPDPLDKAAAKALVAAMAEAEEALGAWEKAQEALDNGLRDAEEAGEVHQPA